MSESEEARAQREAEYRQAEEQHTPALAKESAAAAKKLMPLLAATESIYP